MQNERIDAIDGWRALCVGLVIASHLRFGVLGPLGVEIFFVISGFVIVRGMLAERAKTGGISMAGFYTRRSFRILPPLLLYVAVTSLLVFLQVVPYQETPRALMFLCNFKSGGCLNWLTGHTWSLSVEEQFYLVIPLAVIALHPKALTAAMLGLPLVAIALFAAKLAALGGFLVNFISISAGVALALNEDRVRQWCAGFPRWTWLPALVLLAFLWQLPTNAITTAIKSLTLAPIIVIALMTSLQSRFLSSAPMRQIGQISYGIYLWQELATYDYWALPVAGYLSLIAATLIWCALSFRYFELPLIRIGKRLASGATRPIAASPISN